MGWVLNSFLKIQLHSLGFMCNVTHCSCIMSKILQRCSRNWSLHAFMNSEQNTCLLENNENSDTSASAVHRLKNHNFYYKCCFRLCTMFTKEHFKGLQINEKHKNTFTNIDSGLLITVIYALGISGSFHTHTWITSTRASPKLGVNLNRLYKHFCT